MPNILLGISGSVAAIKSLQLADILKKSYNVRIIITENSKKFLNDALPNYDIYNDGDEESWNNIGDSILHIDLTFWADLFLIAPLSANTLAKISNGLCDNLLTCCVRCWDYEKPLVIAPAMNTQMYINPITTQQLDMMNRLGAHTIPPIRKRLACGVTGIGAMEEIDEIKEIIDRIINKSK